jgi:ketosteroid isomerase-like protein
MAGRHLFFGFRLPCLAILISILLVGCSEPSKSVSSRWLNQTTTSIVAQSDTDRSQDRVQSVIAILTTFLRMADVPTLASMVPEKGLVVVPYGVTTTGSNGLRGESLVHELEALLKNTTPEIVAYDLSGPKHVGLVVMGLNRVRVRPPRSGTILFTDMTYVSLDQSEDGEWQITMVAPDTSGGLAKAIQKPPFEMVSEPYKAEILPATPREVISEVAKLLNKGDAAKLAAMVSDQGLAITPYGLVTRETGLKGDGMLKTMTELFKGAETRVIAYDLSEEGRIGLAIRGLKRTEIQPAIGDRVTMTSLAFMALKLDDQGNWRLWLIAPDSYGFLAQAMYKAPFERWR